MNQEMYLGVDLGTTAVKVGLFDVEGRMRGAAVREFALDTPAPGFVEFDADKYVACAFKAIRQALALAAADPSSVRGIGLSSQAQTFVLLGEEGRPLRAAVSWLDVRAGEEAKDLSQIAARSGGEAVDAIASGSKLLWLRKHEPDVMARVRRFFVIPDYLIFRLTGRHATDPISASSTGMHDWRKGEWLPELVSACGLKKEMLPEVLWPGEVAGTLTAEAARALGLQEDVRVAMGTNDQYAGALGAGNVAPGCASVAFGTALALVLTTGGESRVEKGVEVAPHPVKGLLTVLAYAKTAGIVVRWFRDNFAPSLSYEELFSEAASAPIGSGGVSCIPHFSGMASPTFNPFVRGAFSGLSLAHGRAHLARAIIESLTFSVRENLDLVVRSVGGVKELRAIGGGARSDFWLQMVADATGVSVERPRVREAACLGAAELAMAAGGRFENVAEAARRLYQPERRFAPDPSVKAAYDEAFARYRRLYESLHWT